jgi:hypothetical protein
MTEDHLPVCAAGRWLTREDDFAGMDWQTPCEATPMMYLKVDEHRYTLCQAHFDVVTGQLGTDDDDVVELRMQWDKDRQVYVCPCGEPLSPLDDEGRVLSDDDFGSLVTLHTQLSDHSQYFTAR